MYALYRYTGIWLKITSAQCDSLITDEIYDDTDIEMSTLELLRHVFFFTLKVYWLPRFMLHSCPLNSKRRLKLGELTCIFLTSFFGLYRKKELIMQLEILQFWARHLYFVLSKMFNGCNLGGREVLISHAVERFWSNLWQYPTTTKYSFIQASCVRFQWEY